MIKDKKLTEIKEFLEKKQGYIKWGSQKLADKFNVTQDEIKRVKQLLDGVSELIDTEQTEQLPENLPATIQMPNILVLDIETAPIKASIWGLWNQNIYIDQIISNWFMLTWSASWLGSPDMMSDKLTGKESLEEDDSRIVKSLWHLLNDADIIIAHNGKKFDIPKIKARCLIHGLLPTSFYQQIDTLLVARKEFGFSSNKLDALAKQLGVGCKIKTTFELWTRCINGDESALEEMSTYNNEDVRVLEKVYLKLRPYIKNHPNVTLYDDDITTHRCPTCGEIGLHEEDYYYTTVGQFQVYRCESCGALSRSRKAIKRGVTTANLSLSR
jgi:DNA polymerase elongation subunit (family B)/uncharacterized C2H2 Zn-finger protein